MFHYFHVFFSIYSELQENLIRSHAAGVGTPLSPQQTRRMMALRLNVLLKGFRYEGRARSAFGINISLFSTVEHDWRQYKRWKLH